MIESIIREVCRTMSADLTTDQLQKLEAVMCIQLKDVEIRKQSYEIEPAETYSDARAVKEFLASKRISGRADSTLQQYSFEMWSALEINNNHSPILIVSRGICHEVVHIVYSLLSDVVKRSRVDVPANNLAIS